MTAATTAAARGLSSALRRIGSTSVTPTRRPSGPTHHRTRKTPTRPTSPRTSKRTGGALVGSVLVRAWSDTTGACCWRRAHYALTSLDADVRLRLLARAATRARARRRRLSHAAARARRGCRGVPIGARTWSARSRLARPRAAGKRQRDDAAIARSRCWARNRARPCSSFASCCDAPVLAARRHRPAGSRTRALARAPAPREPPRRAARAARTAREHAASSARAAARARHAHVPGEAALSAALAASGALDYGHVLARGSRGARCSCATGGRCSTCSSRRASNCSCSASRPTTSSTPARRPTSARVGARRAVSARLALASAAQRDALAAPPARRRCARSRTPASGSTSSSSSRGATAR